MRNVTNRTTLDNWIFHTFKPTAAGLGLYRIFASLYMLLFLLPSASMYPFLAGLPADFYHPPPGPFMVFTGFPPVWLWYVLYAVLLISLVGMLVGYRTKMASLMVGTSLFFLKGFTYGLGKIDHDILVIIVPVLMAFSGWGERYSVDEKRGEDPIGAQSWVLALLILLIGFMFFTAGFPKILGGWLDTYSQASEGHFYKHFLVRQRQALLAPFMVNMSDAVWEIADYLTIFFEIGFLAAIFKLKSARMFLCFAALFHLSIMMIMNIPFLPNFLAYAAFINWGWVDDLIKRKVQGIGSTSRRINQAPPLVVSGAIFFVFFLTLLCSRLVTLNSDLTVSAVVLIILFSVIALCYLILEIYRLFVDDGSSDLVKTMRTQEA